ncbi:threonine/serine exporter family protein [Lacticaseibacillus nasuensis]|uniref:threonine/serine exporter family protein n=1 Tax=Lacticaseibacillus nasuensis TaxID=944671 RepID=UPI002246BB1A|nr:threonine/serine exporter family protein [Lacticaseibacillus nasuensis]MCX2456499.1 threonine/serine exporter family protein [Lacticaseibacillus nasuensis]
MAKPTEREVIELCGAVGAILLINGAETARVESTAEYIGQAAGVTVSCHATMTAVFVSAAADPATHLVKVRTGDFNLQKVDDINTLSRRFVAGQIDFATLQAGVTRIQAKVIDFTWPQKLLGAGVVGVAPMLLFKATWGDLAWAFVVGIAGYVAAAWTGRHSTTPYIASGGGGLIIGLLATALQLSGFATSADNIIISALMPLVPGIALTNSLREIIGKHTISGLVRAVDAVMVAGAIGGGVVIGSGLIRALGVL